ncbi:hypothetical protein RND71_021052 [Anisodus tanguticus]|uniref:C2H2-type domain-containing protein n=1 Tax=Anisodus tanguticus TaxID=243964 RepID=A0AAE1V6Y4_9SOLA|nr:hypothetical protein RND71_021052 [Anisodus tanguticus]
MAMKTLKRSKVEEESVEKLAMENCVDIMKRNKLLGRPKLFECKTCKKKIDSFQALGGHRTSHKNTANKLIAAMSITDELLPVKLKKHECSLCG